jgi:hypothetical protein
MSVSIEFIEKVENAPPIKQKRSSSLIQQYRDEEKGERRASVRTVESNNTDDHIYLEDNNADKEDSPLFPTQNVPRRHQFDVEECTSYFPEDSVLKEVFSKDSSMLRFKLYVMW